jgi:hypothetical protein
LIGPGVFIRGDDALSYARNLSVLIAAAEQRGVDLAEGELSAWARVVELRDLLASSRVTAAAAAMGWAVPRLDLVIDRETAWITSKAADAIESGLRK